MHDDSDVRGGIGGFALRHSAAITFLTVVLCLAGAYSALRMPSSIFPQTNFPRVVVLVDNGVMPADEMMATITRPIEEAMKDIPGAVTVRSATSRGSAEVNVFFTWSVDMQQSELYVLGRLSQVRSLLPATARTTVWRLTFSAFPIIGLSLTSPTRDITDLWETARYDISPRLLRIPGVRRVDLVGGRTPEYHVVVDPLRLQASALGLADITAVLRRNNLVESTGFLEENFTLYLALVDGRLRSTADIENLVVAVRGQQVVRVSDVARVERGQEPVFNVVTADGVRAVLINIRSQPDGSTLEIAKAVAGELEALRNDLPPDMRIASFYDQSLLVRDSVASVWEAIGFGLILSVGIIYLFLRSWGITLTAVVVIPVTVLVTLMAMRLIGLTFNLMTLGGIAAAIGLVIDDAIVVVEAIHAKLAAGESRLDGIRSAIGAIARPLVGSTLTPVVVFLPLAWLDGITGVFFRSLAVTMTVSLLTSLVLAVTLTPSLAGWLLREEGSTARDHADGPLLRRANGLYEWAVRATLRHRALALVAVGLVLLAAVGVYGRLPSEFLPAIDEGAFVIDYFAPPGTSLTETDRQLQQAEEIIRAKPEVESYSRRTGARLALALAEPNTGDFLVKLHPGLARATDDVIATLRAELAQRVPGIRFSFAGILGDLIGDLTYAPKPIEVRLYSTDVAWLSKKAPEIEAVLRAVPGVVDTFDGLVETGPSLTFRVRQVDAERFGITAEDIARTASAAMIGETASSVLEGDRVVAIRVRAEPSEVNRAASLRTLLIRAADGRAVPLAQVADIVEVPGQLQLRRDDLRQDVAVVARLEGRDLGSAMAEIRRRLSEDPSIPAGALEFAGLYQEQQAAFVNLVVVLGMAILLVFFVLLVEFRSVKEPLAIVAGAVLALSGTLAALWITGTTLSVVSFLGAIIGVGIVAKNGILLLDAVADLRASGVELEEAIVRAGHRRLRPVLMTSLAAALGMLPLAYGVGTGAAMLQPLAIAVIGALATAVLLSLVATPTLFFVLTRRGSEAALEVP